ncbi:MAG: HipA family kinase, partial [Candidatus Acidiferrales bacterium]
MRVAIEHVRRMRGGAQAQLMRCDDGGYYIVKFQNNPQHLRILANEMLATRLAARLGISVPQIEVVEVRAELIAYSSDLVIQLGMGKKPCAAGKQFGSQFPGHPAQLAVHDFLPEEELLAVRNFTDFLGIYVFDKWTYNTNGRQAIFFREAEEAASAASAAAAASGAAIGVAPVNTASMGSSGAAYAAMMIDHGFCFNAGEWDFPDAPLRGLYARQRVYQNVRGMDSFEPWLTRLETRMTEAVLGEEASRIPPEWYADDWAALERLIERLYARRKRVRELIESARK